MKFNFFGVSKKSKPSKKPSLLWSNITKHPPKSFSMFGSSKPKASNFSLNWAQVKRKYPNLKPLADTDGDGLLNMFDCKPLNKKRKGTYYHGTTSMSSDEILKEGLKPSAELKEKNPHASLTTSKKTDPNKVYVFKDAHHAKTYASLSVQQKGMGRPIVLAVDIDDNELERDEEMEQDMNSTAFKKTGEVPAEKVKLHEGNIAYPGEEEEFNYGTPNYKKTARDIELENESDEEDEDNLEEDDLE